MRRYFPGRVALFWDCEAVAVDHADSQWGRSDPDSAANMASVVDLDWKYDCSLSVRSTFVLLLDIQIKEIPEAILYSCYSRFERVEREGNIKLTSLMLTLTFIYSSFRKMLLISFLNQC